MLESLKHSQNSFWTLTYDPEHWPSNGSLDPEDARNWLKRLREKVGYRSLRYYLVGEYGDQTWRPHYHAALFGVPNCRTPDLQRTRRGCSCDVCQAIRSTWQKGNVFGGELTTESAAYVAGYMTKKMTSRDDPRLQGRHPEFARMSLRPGIGAHAVGDIARVLHSEHGSKAIRDSGDVPTALMHGRSMMPLGRYLRRKLREEVGFENVGGQDVYKLRTVAELQALSETHGCIAAALKAKASSEAVKISQIEGKARIWSKKGSI